MAPKQVDAQTRDTVRSVTRAVVQRLGSARPEVIEAVVAEVLGVVDIAGSPSGGATVTTPRGAVLLPMAVQGAEPSIDYCSACVEQEQARGRQRAVMTTTGKNHKGIVAKVTSRIADLGGDILDISQTLISDYFTMIIVIDVGSLSVPFDRFQEDLTSVCREIGVQTMLMHEEVMASLHRV